MCHPSIPRVTNAVQGKDEEKYLIVGQAEQPPVGWARVKVNFPREPLLTLKVGLPG